MLRQPAKWQTEKLAHLTSRAMEERHDRLCNPALSVHERERYVRART